MKDTSVGNIWFSKSALGQNNGLKLRIFGNKGAVEWYQENPDHFFYYDKYGSKIEINQSSPLLNISNSKDIRDLSLVIQPDLLKLSQIIMKT